jgi:chromate transporter
VSPVVPLRTIAREWLWIGITGFGGPPAHIALLRRLCVDRRGWVSAAEFEDGVAACNLLPGPASTQLSIWLAWRLRRTTGALLGGVCFIAPGLVAILGLSVVFLARAPHPVVLGAAAGAGAAVAAVAIHAAASLVPSSWKRASGVWGRRRWLLYALLGAVAPLVIGPWVVLVLLGAGVAEVLVHRHRFRAPAALVPVFGGLAPLAWTAFKVGALSYGGGFVIIPLMQSDAVRRYHWLSDGQFLYAVALGQITPGPVVHTVAVVGYAAAGIGGGLLAAARSPRRSCSSSSAPRTSTRCAVTPRPSRSSPEPGPAPSGRSRARPSCWGSASVICGSSGYWRWPRSGCWCCAGASCRPCSARPRSASWPPWSASPSPPDPPRNLTALTVSIMKLTS